MKNPFKTFMKWGMVAVFALVGTAALAQFTLQQISNGDFVVRNEATGVDVLLFKANNDILFLGTRSTTFGGGNVVLGQLNRWCGVGFLADVSTESTWIFVSPVTGTLRSVQTVLGGGLATADATIRIDVGATSLGSDTITIANSGAALGDIDSNLAVSSNTVLGEVTTISIGTDGASTNTTRIDITVCVDIE